MRVNIFVFMAPNLFFVSGLRTIYCNPETRLCLIQCRHGPHRLVSVLQNFFLRHWCSRRNNQEGFLLVKQFETNTIFGSKTRSTESHPFHSGNFYRICIYFE